jgi:hypothetical protein
VRRASVADLVADPRHGGNLDGASRRGAASGGDRLLVRVALWLDGAGGGITRAGFQATTCASLIAYAELACRLLEAGADPAALDAPALRHALAGVHPLHYARAELVARALRSALDEPIATPPKTPEQ